MLAVVLRVPWPKVRRSACGQTKGTDSEKNREKRQGKQELPEREGQRALHSVWLQP